MPLKSNKLKMYGKTKLDLIKCKILQTPIPSNNIIFYVTFINLYKYIIIIW